MADLRCHGRTIDALLSISRAVSGSFDLDKVSGLVLREARRIFRVDHAALFLLDDQIDKMMLVRAEGFTEDQAANIHLLGSWEAINEYLIYHRLPTFVSDIDSHPIFRKRHSPLLTKRFPVKSFLASPLIKEKSVVGTLILSTKKRAAIFEEDEKLIAILSDFIAITLSAAKLFDELSKMHAETAQSEKMAVIGTLAAGINHEINNPLGIARAQCEIFLLNSKEGYYKDKTDAMLFDMSKEIMAAVMHEIDRAVGISRRLSNFSKPSTGEAEPIDIGKEIDEVLGLLSHGLRLSDIRFEKTISPGTPAIVVDRKQFQEVLFNLIRNAAQAIDKEGAIALSVTKKRKNISIQIRDTGSGIAKEHQKDLFRPFFTTKGAGKGTGMGLFIVRKIVEKNGGTIKLKQTKVGKGTTFEVEFPIKAG